MTTSPTALPVPTVTPHDVARDVMGTIRGIEAAILDTNSQIHEVESRGIFKSVFSSDRSDLIALSKSQNRINDLMLDMIREIISLNVMSYSFLAGVLDEFMQMARNGWTDTDGRVHRLSETGKEFADSASRIFVKIIEGSRSTRQAIELNAEQIDDLRAALAAKQDVDEAQSRQLADLDSKLQRKAEWLERLNVELANKSLLDERQSRELQAARALLEDTGSRVGTLATLLETNERLDREQAQSIATLAARADELARRCDSLETCLADSQVRLLSTVASLTHVRRVAVAALVGVLALAVAVATLLP